MFPQLRFFLGLLACIPLLPVLIIQGKRVRQSIPRLPEAGGARVGSIGEGSGAIRLLTLGESTIAGVGVADHQEGITGQIATSLHELSGKKIHWEVIAKSGYTARRVTELLVPHIPERRIDLIVIGLGGNDTFHLNTPRRWVRDFSDLLHALRNRQPSCPIIIADLPPVAEFPAFPRLMRMILGGLLHLHHLAIRKLPANFNSVCYMDTPIRLENWGKLLPEGKSPADFFSDGVHPSPLTYSIWGKQIARFAIQHSLVEGFEPQRENMKEHA